MAAEGISDPELCACGQPLHYSNPEIRALVERIIALVGSRYVPLVVEGRAWYVDRHYIALHGLTAAEIPTLSFQELFICPRCHRISFNRRDLEQRYCGACHIWV